MDKGFFGPLGHLVGREIVHHLQREELAGRRRLDVRSARLGVGAGFRGTGRVGRVVDDAAVMSGSTGAERTNLRPTNSGNATAQRGVGMDQITVTTVARCVVSCRMLKSCPALHRKVASIRGCITRIKPRVRFPDRAGVTPACEGRATKREVVCSNAGRACARDMTKKTRCHSCWALTPR